MKTIVLKKLNNVNVINFKNTNAKFNAVLEETYTSTLHRE